VDVDVDDYRSRCAGERVSEGEEVLGRHANRADAGRRPSAARSRAMIDWWSCRCWFLHAE
jgi:hypothetical protein